MTSTGASGRGPATEPLRWGLIGSGLIATSFAADLSFTDSGRVVAIGSRSQESADRFADKFGIPNRHASYEGLVADPEVDVVYVATPHPMHLANALLALDAGKPVLVEKAFTMTRRRGPRAGRQRAGEEAVRDGGDVDTVPAPHSRSQSIDRRRHAR